MMAEAEAGTSPAPTERPARQDGQVAERFDRIRYEDLSEEASWDRIGKGSFGSVWRGEYLGLEVAIKEVLPSTEYDVEKYMAREITLMQQARHPNIVQYLGLCLAPPASASTEDSPTADDNTPGRSRILIISEYLPRGNLRQYILDRTLPFPWRLRISFATDIARALAYLHARNTMHRDLKGENLLVSDNERLKACDFGLARVAQALGAVKDDQKKPSDMYTYCGTDGYMSPEILLGLPFDCRTDIYSLGILFIEIATRKLASQSVFARRPPDYSLSHDEVWSSVSAHCPHTFVELALQCCDEDPDRRPDCKKILRRLRDIEQDVKEMEMSGLGDEDAHTRGAGTYNVGSISFAGTLKRGSLAPSKRPGAPRLPSFEGKIDLRKGSVFAPVLPGLKPATSTSIRDLEGSLGHADARLGTESDDEDGEALFALANAEVTINHAPSVEEAYSTSVVRPSQIRAPYGRLGSTSGSQLPTLPTSWIMDPSRFADADEDANTETVIMAAKAEVETARDPVSAITTGTETLSLAETVISATDADDEQDVFHSAFQEPTHAVEAAAEWPHRFSLIKPGLQRFLGSLLPHPAASSQASRSPSRAAATNGKCGQCAKNFGLMKPYLACDDCGLASHIKCSDAVPASCSVVSFSSPSSPVTSLSPSAPPKPARRVPPPQNV